MNTKTIFSFLIFFSSFLLFISCNEISNKAASKPSTIAIQPFAFNDTAQISLLKKYIENYYHFKVIVLSNKEIPKEAYYEPRNRYKADKLIKILKSSNADAFDYIIGITEKDISTKKGNIPDFGIFGLGYQPGKSCVISSFRLKTTDKKLVKERMIKVALHEIGHNLGLPHCSASTDCFMHAAEASIKQIDKEKMDMCDRCKHKIGL